MSNRDIYRTPAVRWGYDAKDMPVGAEAELHTKRGPVKARGKGLEPYAPDERTGEEMETDEEPAAHPS